jgi:hypothetical protein
MTNIRNSHVWSLDDPHASRKTFSEPFSVNILCDVIASQEWRSKAATRWRTRSSWQAGNCISQSTYSKSLKCGRHGPVALPPRSPDLTTLAYNLRERMTFLVYAVKSSARGERLNRTFDASAYIRNDGPSLRRSVTSFSRKATMCIESGRSFRAISSYRNDAATRGNIFGTPAVEQLSVPSSHFFWMY